MTRKVKSLDRGLVILSILASGRTPMSCTEIAREMGLDPSSIYRLLVTLGDRGFVEQNPRSKRFSLGLRLVELGGIVVSSMGLRGAGRESLKELADRTGRTTHLAVLLDCQALYIDREEGPSIMGVTTEIGGKVPAYCTSVGKVLLAGLPRMRLREVVEHLSLQRFTAKTLVSPSELIEHLEEVREQGYAIDDEEFCLGVRCIAAPIKNYGAETIAALGISDLTASMPITDFPRLAREVCLVAEELSMRQGYLPLRPRG